MQAVSGAASIVFAAGLTSTGVGAPVALGIATFGFDNLQAGSQALLKNQLARTLGGRTLELTGLSSEKAELLYSILDLTATMKVIKLAVSKGGYQMLQVNVSSGKVDQIKLIRAKINRRHHIVADELKVVDAAEAAKGGATVQTVDKPGWLVNVEQGRVFNAERSFAYPHNELYINKSTGSGYYRLDSYNPSAGEIVSRKYTQFSEIQTKTAISYINELQNKYPVGGTIANVPSSGDLAGATLRGQYFLEVPVQKSPIPKSVLDAANKAKVIIRDVDGRIY